jgi:hypothetical protein
VNTNGLAKHYGQLTPWERVPLLLAARQRDDEAEALRLEQSAPRINYNVVDFYGVHEGLLLVASSHMMIQLDLAAQLWRMEAMAADHAFLRGGKRNDQLADRLERNLRILAWRLVLNADAWRLFCGELGVDPEAVLPGCPGKDMVDDAESLARLLAFAPEEALAWFRDRDKAHAPSQDQTRNGQNENWIPIAADVARQLRQALDSAAEPFG